MRIRQLIEIARLEEARLARAVSEIAREARTWCGGMMMYESPGSWANFAAGVDFDRAYTEADLDELIAFHSGFGAEPRIEMAPFVPKSLIDLLRERGFTLRGFETVFACEIANRRASAFDSPAGLTIEPVNVDDEEEVVRFARFATRGFLSADDPPDKHVLAAIKAAKHPRAVNVMAMMEGEPIGAGSMEVAGELVTLYGVSVEEAYRKRGVQRALIEHRLAIACERGAQIATISSKPGVATERNAMRAGFMPSYTKVAMALAGEWLVASEV